MSYDCKPLSPTLSCLCLMTSRCYSWWRYRRLDTCQSPERKPESYCCCCGSCSFHLSNPLPLKLTQQGKNLIEDLNVLAPGLVLSMFGNDTYDWVCSYPALLTRWLNRLIWSLFISGLQDYPSGITFSHQYDFYISNLNNSTIGQYRRSGGRATTRQTAWW